MSLVVEKFGGTSVGTVDRINHVADHLIHRQKVGERLVVVVSAMRGETNRLDNLASQISSVPTPRERDVLLATGEQVTIALLSMALHSRGCAARSYTAAQVAIQTDSEHSKARILDINVDKIHADLDNNQIVVIAGFQGVDCDGNITTLGRGGSDTSAVAIAAALKADECRIYTDVDGVFTADPKLVPSARCLNDISYDEMRALSGSGAKVLNLNSVKIASKYNVPLRVLSSFNSVQGTYITYHKKKSKVMTPLVSGIAFQDNDVKLSVLNIPDTFDAIAQILRAISEAGIAIDIISQKNGFYGFIDLSFTVTGDDHQSCLEALRSSTKKYVGVRIENDHKIAKIAIIGIDINSHDPFNWLILKTLADNSIGVNMISTSEIKITVIISKCDLNLAVNVLHDAFGLCEIRPPILTEITEQVACI